MTNNNTTKGNTMNIPKGFINGLKWTKFVQAGNETVYQTTFRGQTWAGFCKQEVLNLIAAKYGLFDCRYSADYEHEDKIQKMGGII
jgi:hypothetical protein